MDKRKLVIAIAAGLALGLSSQTMAANPFDASEIKQPYNFRLSETTTDNTKEVDGLIDVKGQGDGTQPKEDRYPSSSLKLVDSDQDEEAEGEKRYPGSSLKLVADEEVMEPEPEERYPSSSLKLVQADTKHDMSAPSAIDGTEDTSGATNGGADTSTPAATGNDATGGTEDTNGVTDTGTGNDATGGSEDTSGATTNTSTPDATGGTENGETDDTSGATTDTTGMETPEETSTSK